MKKNHTGICVFFALFLTMPVTVWSQQDEEDSSYLPPEELAIPENDQYQAEKEHAGGRLERVTITWNNGITEVYHNRRDDALWASDESELDGVQNVRQWKLFNW